ncbi:hypothetical protein [Halomonas huangheensis]|uniref:Preprotein translocase subunit YajC n=1 Tax=Halomonas huangheensis TaxID=1178482 RepID=W1N462_9GAMM|nr:hypothetical protein [Halomonas huangheensis]ALM51826.1 hypothetical protein AR456_05655 [Halomonas huangheensis]ERL50342.1 hypothetical protein BJB45_04225 [Halomonas huangheensis]
MLWLMILVVVGLVFAPAMWLRPSVRDRRLARLRSAAAGMDVSVRLEDGPLHGNRDKMAAYRWLYPGLRPGPGFLLVRDTHASHSLKSYVQGWRWRVEPLRPLTPQASALFSRLLSQLPEDAVVVQSNDKSLTVWWDESLEAEAFAQLAAPATALRDVLQGNPDRVMGGVPNTPP